jgi:hypothetical protein
MVGQFEQQVLQATYRQPLDTKAMTRDNRLPTDPFGISASATGKEKHFRTPERKRSAAGFF